MILATGTYDPEEDEGRKRPSHITKKELVFVALGLVLLFLLLIPVYNKLKRDRDSHICLENLASIAQAMTIYQESNNARFPPIYMTSDTGYEPRTDNGLVYTWVSLLAPAMTARANFICPAAIEEENVTNENSQTGASLSTAIISSYGMYGALQAFPKDSVPEPSGAALIADSASNGANGTIDPKRFKDSTGRTLPDGFLIGLDNSNFTPDDTSLNLFVKSASPTRLAFPASAKSGFASDTEGRHDGTIHVLMADLHVRSFTPLEAKLRHLGKSGEIEPPWAIQQ